MDRWISRVAEKGKGGRQSSRRNECRKGKPVRDGLGLVEVRSLVQPAPIDKAAVDCKRPAVSLLVQPRLGLGVGHDASPTAVLGRVAEGRVRVRVKAGREHWRRGKAGQ
jgi:hypothetical protein